MPTRVASFACLEDVKEEDFQDHVKADMWTPAQLPGQCLVPMWSFSQLQQQPVSPRLTAARLALTSDITILRRSLHYDTAENQQLSTDRSPAKNIAQVLKDRELVMASSAVPMSRSFATPRMAVSTAFRNSISASSLSSLYTANGKEDDDDQDLPSLLLTLSATRVAHCTPAAKSTVPLQLEGLADDIQVHILSFVLLKDIRSVMATNRRYRKLLFTQDAQNLWKHWCHRHQWPQLLRQQQQQQPQDDCRKEFLLVDDLSLPTAARPSPLERSAMMMSPWHQQANLSLLLSMAQSQPTDIDQTQLNKYHTWRYASVSSSSRRRRSRNRIHTIDQEQQPLLTYAYLPEKEQWLVQFTGRVGHGDRCVRSNQALPRPTLIPKKEWIVPPVSSHSHKLLISPNRQSDYRRSSSSLSSSGGLLDLFCRSTRAAAPPRPAWRPFVAPFVTQEATVHLTPRFVSYFEVSILEPTASKTSSRNSNTAEEPRARNIKDCVAVGVATETFDWHTRMPGWDAASFGYHGDDGGIFHSSGGMLREFGPSFGRGDVVGCGIDHVMRGIFYTLNGRFLGYAWTELPLELLERDMYPVVGIDTNDYIHCNFGTEPFEYDLTSMVVRHEEFVHQSLSLAAKA